MSRNSALTFIMLLAAGCDNVAVGNRTQRSGEVKVTGVEQLEENVSEALEGVGAPMAWRVVQGAAFYGAASEPPVFALRCDRSQNSVLFERAGGGPALNISAGGVGVSLGTREVGAGRVQARTGMGDAVLDAMARSQAQISVSGGAEALTVPGGIAIRRVIDFCRTPPAPVTPVADNAMAPVEPVVPPVVPVPPTVPN